MSDSEAIVALLRQVAWLLDERQWDGFDHVFTTDATAYGADGPGIASIVSRIREFLGGCGPSQHLLGNHEISVHGDSARARTSFRALHQGLGERSGSTYEVVGYYHDELRRSDSGWRISDRVIDVRISIGDMSVLQPG